MARYRGRRPAHRAYDKRPGWMAVDLSKQTGPSYFTIPEGHTLYVWHDHIPPEWGSLSAQDRTRWEATHAQRQQG